MRNLVISVFLCLALLGGMNVYKPLQELKDVTVEAKTITKEKHYTKKEALQIVCKNNGLDTEFCWKDLMAMVYVESRGYCDAVGDNNKSHGCLQIQIKLHNITKEQAQDFWFASDWTLKRMIRNGYPTMRSFAIRKHNGWSKASRAYLEEVNRVVNYL